MGENHYDTLGVPRDASAQRVKVAYRRGSHRAVDLDAGLRRETPRLGLWIDSSDQTPDQTVDAIVAQGLELGRVQ